MLRAVATDDQVAGFEAVERAPLLDTDGRTAAGTRTITHSVVTTEIHHD
ncbi:hypothetical protein [Halalkalicoccus sp. NIPERK01]|nr:hypothetical protein [Halalkalicoccus sp. NIPERK01]MDL5363132.1 hypothetical protein [Halalkalicoccus sp. NIPERK01]